MGSGVDSEREALLRELKHPIRIRILEISAREPTKVLSAAALRKRLAGDFKGLQTGQVAYHLARLQDAELVPRPRPRTR